MLTKVCRISSLLFFITTTALLCRTLPWPFFTSDCKFALEATKSPTTDRTLKWPCAVLTLNRKGCKGVLAVAMTLHQSSPTASHTL